MILRLLPLAAAALTYGAAVDAGPVAYDDGAPFPWGGRALGLAMHCAAVATLFEVWRRIRERRDEAFFAACLFAVLPATSEAVIAAAGRGPQAVVVLTLAALLVHRQARPAVAAAVAASAQGLALACHATGAALAPLLLLHDALLLRRPASESLARVGGALAVAAAALITEATPGPLGDVWAAAPFVGEGLGRTLLPHTQTVAWLPERPTPLFAALLYAAALLVAVGVVALRRQRPTVPTIRLFGLGWWGFAALPLLPEALSGRTVPEAGLYLAIVGPCLWLGRDAAEFQRWFRHIGRGRLASGLLAAVILLLGARAALRAQDWTDDFLLHLSSVEDEPYNPEALFRYGTYLATQGEALSSARALARAHEVVPERADIANNLAVTLMRRREWAMAETVLRAALARQPDNGTVRRNLDRLASRDARNVRLIEPSR